MRQESENLKATLVLPQQVANEIDAIARLPVETAGVLLASVVRTLTGHIRILARKIHWVKDSSYVVRGADHLSIASEGYVPFLAEGEAIGATAIWVHTHPGVASPPQPSGHDKEVDRQISELFRLRTGSQYYGSIIFAPRQQGIAFTGYLQADSDERIAVKRLWEVGDRFRLTRSFDLPALSMQPMFDRNVRALGGAIQEALSELCVGIVGCGGTGSAIAEQLIRLGVRHLMLFDPDHISASNVTRVYGSSVTNIGQPKTEVLAAHLAAIAPDTHCERIQAMITMQNAAMHLCSCDIVFGCTDDNAGRLVLSRFATYLLTPVFDCGVLLTSDTYGALVGIDGRVTTLVPGQACLVCRGRIDLKRAAAELLTPSERRRREDEGYAPALGRTEPAVIPFTTLVAAASLSELLERFVGYGCQPPPSEILFRCHDREISTNIQAPRVGHYCHPEAGKLGMGVTSPFLEQTWPE